LKFICKREAVDLQKISFWVLRSKRATQPAAVEYIKPSAVGWKPTVSTRLCLCEKMASGSESDCSRPFSGMCQTLTCG